MQISNTWWVKGQYACKNSWATRYKCHLCNIKTDLIPISKGEIKYFILALPELSINGYINEQCGCSYYVIDSHWNELDQQIKFKKPKSPGCKY